MGLKSAAFVAATGTSRKIGQSDFLSHCVSKRESRESSGHVAVPLQRRVVVESKRSNSRGQRRGDGRRPNRVGELIRREMCGIIDDAYARNFRRPGNVTSSVLVSVVDVKCSDDLRNARVSVSVLGSEEQKSEIMKWLKISKKELRYELAQSVYLKYVPELSFEESGMASAVKTMGLLERLAQEREVKESTRQGSSNETTWGLSEEKITVDLGLDEDGIIDETEEYEESEDEDDVLIIDVDDDGEDEEGCEDVRDGIYKRVSGEEI